MKRQVWIDYLKAIAALAVVTFHVIYGLQNAGIYTHTYLNVLKDFCDIFQIPVFMMASGYLYGMAGRPKSYFSFEGKKLINLGVPYLVFSVIYFGINSLFSSAVNFSYDLKTLLMLPVKPIAQYWYMFALILIFLVVPLLEMIFKNEYLVFALLLIWKILGLSGVLFDYEYATDYYLAGYAIFFYMGTLYARKHDDFKIIREKAVYIIGLIFIVLFALAYMVDNGSTIVPYYRFLLNMLGIVTFALMLEKGYSKVECGFIKLIAKYSFQIYLLHTMATAAVRIVLVRVGIYNDLIHFILGMTVGLTCSIIAAVLCDKTRVLNILFFPVSTVKKMKADRA